MLQLYEIKTKIMTFLLSFSDLFLPFSFPYRCNAYVPGSTHMPAGLTFTSGAANVAAASPAITNGRVEPV